MAENPNIDEMKTLSQWIKDPRVPLKKFALWTAIKDGRLKASRPLGAKMWLVKWSDLSSFLGGSTNA
jgi:hypothetical protein